MHTNLKQIGRGLFSTVYRRTKNTVLIKSTCYAKECMALGWFPKSRLFPPTQRIGEATNGVGLYTQPYYLKVASLKCSLLPAEYSFYLALRNIDRGQNTLKDLYKAFGTLPPRYARRKAALVAALDALCNYGDDIRFEISPRNVAVKSGRLILLDCFFFFSQAEAARKARCSRPRF